MRELTAQDAQHAVLGGGVLACGGGGWLHHGELMGAAATTLTGRCSRTSTSCPPTPGSPPSARSARPAAPTWEIRPVDYVHALQRPHRGGRRPDHGGDDGAERVLDERQRLDPVVGARRDGARRRRRRPGAPDGQARRRSASPPGPGTSPRRSSAAATATSPGTSRSSSGAPRRRPTTCSATSRCGPAASSRAPATPSSWHGCASTRRWVPITVALDLGAAMAQGSGRPGRGEAVVEAVLEHARGSRARPRAARARRRARHPGRVGPRHPARRGRRGAVPQRVHGG